MQYRKAGPIGVFIYMLVVGIGLGSAMQPLVLAVQNDLALRDMGAGTATATFFRSLGGAVGVAALGAVLSNKLASLASAGGTGQQISINDPASIQRLPEAARHLVENVFVNALHPIFLTAGLVTVVAVLLSLLLPNRELKGASAAPAPSSEGLPALADEDGELAAIEMESQASTMI